MEPTIEQIAHEISQQPVGYQYQDRDGNWKPFISEKHYQDTLADGSWLIRPVFARPFFVSNYEAALADHARLVRELDVLWNGEAGAAKQASLCDMVSQIRRELPALRAAPAGVQDGWSIKRDGDVILVQKEGVGGYVARQNEDNIASEILYWLADSLLRSAPAAPADADAAAKDAGCNRGHEACDCRTYCIDAAMQGKAAATMPKGCHRSHPHEDMGPECQRKTIEARQQFMEATSQAPYLIHGEPDALEQGEPA